MSFTNFQKTIALSGGVLVLSVAVALVVIAWTGPTAEPPLNNAPEPLNTGATAQVKTGDLTVGNLFLDGGTGEGNIQNADEIIGYNDLQLHSGPTNKTEILLDDGTQGIKLKHQGTDVLVVGDDDAVHFPELTSAPDFTGCFLELDEFGKVRCYTGGGIPGGNVLETTQVEVASVILPWDEHNMVCDSYTVQASDVEKVIRVYMYIHNNIGERTRFYFYINDIQQWTEFCDVDDSTCSDSKYYHITAGDEAKICIDPLWTSLDLDKVRNAYIYTLGSYREDITHAFAEEPKILYWYDQATIGEMSPAGAHYIGPDPISSVIISAKDEVDVSWIID